MSAHRANSRFHLTQFGFLAVTLWLAFALRLLYARRISPFVDEYISMLAVRSIVEKGLPIMPSGLMYGPKALLHSYLGAFFFWTMGPLEFSVRFLSVLTGVVTVGLILRVGRDWFSTAVGMASAIALAWLPSAVEWSGRARMYGLMQLLLLLGGYLCVNGYLRACNRRTREIGLFVLILAVLTHTLAIIAVAGLAIGVAIARWFSRQEWKAIAPLSTREVLAGLILVALTFVFALTGIAWGPQVKLADVAQGSVEMGEKALYLLAFTHRFVTWPLWPLTIFYAVGFINLFSRWVKRSPLPDDKVALALYVVLLFAWLATSASATLHDDRYLFGIVPFYLLLAFREVHRFSRTILSSIPSCSPSLKTLGSLTVMAGLAIVLFAPTTLQLVSHNTLDFVPAFEFVKDAWRPGDAVATCSPAASLLILGRADYYLAQLGAEGESFRGRDVWTGSPLLNTPEKLGEVLDERSRTWVVTEELCFERRFDAHFRQFIRDNMQLVFDRQGMFVFVSNPR